MKNLKEQIEKLSDASGYLVMISRIEKDQETINHTFFTDNFPKEDLALSLEEHGKLLEKEKSV